MSNNSRPVFDYILVKCSTKGAMGQSRCQDMEEARREYTRMMATGRYERWMVYVATAGRVWRMTSCNPGVFTQYTG